MKKHAWSFSSLNAFENCAFRYYLTRVAKKVVEPENDAAKWGNLVHEAFEYHIKEGRPLPESMRAYQKLMDKLSAAKGTVFAEMQICLDENFQPVEWFSKKAWVRGIIDYGVQNEEHMVALDYKTGKRKVDSDQLALFSALLFHYKPELERTTTGFLWLQENKVDRGHYVRSDLPKIWNSFLPRVERLDYAFEKDKWPKRPSGLCKKHCPVGRSLCEFCGS